MRKKTKKTNKKETILKKFKLKTINFNKNKLKTISWGNPE